MKFGGRLRGPLGWVVVELPAVALVEVVVVEAVVLAALEVVELPATVLVLLVAAAESELDEDWVAELELVKASCVEVDEADREVLVPGSELAMEDVRLLTDADNELLLEASVPDGASWVADEDESELLSSESEEAEAEEEEPMGTHLGRPQSTRSAHGEARRAAW